MGIIVGISSFELDEDEKVVLESPTICSIEFEKQEDFFESLIGLKVGGRAIAKPYLTSNRILIWLGVIPYIGEPKQVWYDFSYENISYLRSGKSGKIEKGKKGLEIEFATPKVGGVASIIGRKMQEKGGVTGWLGRKIGEQKIKLWLYLPDYPVWSLQITKLMQQRKIIK